MNCEQAQNLIDTYLDGELSGSLAAEFGAHKLQCSSCRRELALLEVAGHVIAADVDVPELNEVFTERLLACTSSACSVGWPRRVRNRVAVFSGFGKTGETGATESSKPWRWRWMVYGGSSLAAAACLAMMFLPVFGVALPSDGQPSSASGEVLDYREVVGSLEEMLANIEDALSHDPDNPRLREAAGLFRAAVAGTIGSASVLEKYGKETMMEILQSIPIDAVAGDAVAGDAVAGDAVAGDAVAGDAAVASEPETPEGRNDPSVEDL